MPCLVCGMEKDIFGDMCKLCGMRTASPVLHKNLPFCCKSCAGHFDSIIANAPSGETDIMLNQKILI